MRPSPLKVLDTQKNVQQVLFSCDGKVQHGQKQQVSQIATCGNLDPLVFLEVVVSSIGLLHVRHWRASVAWSIPAKLLKIRVVPHGGTQKLPPALGDWATDKLYDWADKMVHAAPSRCCVVVGDLNAHIGYVRHPEREALNLEREPWRDVWTINVCNGVRLFKFCRDQHTVMVNTHYPKRWHHILECTERQRSRIETGLHVASSHATSNGYTLFRPSKRGPTPSAHSSPTPTGPLAADDKIKKRSCHMEESQWLREMRWHGILMQSCPLSVTLIDGYLYSKK